MLTLHIYMFVRGIPYPFESIKPLPFFSFGKMPLHNQDREKRITLKMLHSKRSMSTDSTMQADLFVQVVSIFLLVCLSIQLDEIWFT